MIPKSSAMYLMYACLAMHNADKTDIRWNKDMSDTTQECGPNVCSADTLDKWGKCTCGYPARTDLRVPDTTDTADKMCQTVTSANVGYGPDFDVPCGAKAMFIAQYDLFVIYDAETGETDFWTACTETVCDTHRGQMVSYVNEHPNEMQITSIAHIPGTTVNQDKTDNQPNTGKSDISGYMDWIGNAGLTD